MKKCNKCAKEKNLVEFFRDRHSPDGHRYSCKNCQKEYGIEYAKNNREKVNKQAREWRYQNPERYSELNKQNYENHKKARLEYAEKYRGRTSESRRQKRFEDKRKNPAKFLLASAKMNAKKKGLEFNIDINDIQIPEKCPILGMPLFVGTELRCNNSPSLDRIDSTKGYIKENIQVISWRANNLKADATKEEIHLLNLFMEKLP